MRVGEISGVTRGRWCCRHDVSGICDARESKTNEWCIIQWRVAVRMEQTIVIADTSVDLIANESNW